MFRVNENVNPEIKRTHVLGTHSGGIYWIVRDYRSHFTNINSKEKEVYFVQWKNKEVHFFQPHKISEVNDSTARGFSGTKQNITEEFPE